MKSVTSTTVNVWVGFKEGYDGHEHGMHEAQAIVQKYVNEVGWCFSVRPVDFIYRDGNEPGVCVSAINYPRFPNSKSGVVEVCMGLATRLGKAFNQHRVTVEVVGDMTYLLEKGADY